jgi:hypothetical protein
MGMRSVPRNEGIFGGLRFAVFHVIGLPGLAIGD